MTATVHLTFLAKAYVENKGVSFDKAIDTIAKT